jgi:hypothetical protein
MASPARYYEWLIMLIDRLIETGTPTFDQPSWLVLKDVLLERIKKLEADPINAMLTQEMTDWKSFSFFSKEHEGVSHPWLPPPTGPLSRIVAAIDKIAGAIRRAVSTLEYESKDRDRDIIGRSITPGEAANIAWNLTVALRDNPLFSFMDHYGWNSPYPWLEFCEKDLRELRDEWQDDEGLRLDPGTSFGDTPWSMPKI